MRDLETEGAMYPCRREEAITAASFRVRACCSDRSFAPTGMYPLLDIRGSCACPRACRWWMADNIRRAVREQVKYAPTVYCTP